MNCNAWNDVCGVPCVWGLERYVRNVNQKAKKRIHGTERKRLSHWFFYNKVKNNDKETYKLFL